MHPSRLSSPSAASSLAAPDDFNFQQTADLVKNVTFKVRMEAVLHKYDLVLSGRGESAIESIRSFSLEQARGFSQACVELLADYLQPAQENKSPSTSKSPSFVSAADSHPADGARTSSVGSLFTNPSLELFKYVRERMSMSISKCGDAAQQEQCVIQQTRQLIKAIDEEGNKMINRYTVIDDLGRGAYGKVKLAVDEANCPVAIKIVRKDVMKPLGGANGIEREIAVMKKLKHRNVVPLYEVIDDPDSKKLYMVMKYVDQGPIAQLRADGTCDPIPAERVREVMGELVSGLSYLHKRGVAHRDIKPDNILVDAAGTPYFVDFGVSAIIDKDNPNVSTVEGTVLFMPPELFDDDPSIRVNAFVADVWSLGVTLYMLLYGIAPFNGSNFSDISFSVRYESVVFPPRAAGVGEEWQDLLRGMLNKDPTQRMTLKAVKKHPALREADVTIEEIQAATSRCKIFLADDENLLTSMVDPGLSRSIRKSVVMVPRCARRSIAAITTTTTTTIVPRLSAHGSLEVLSEHDDEWPKNFSEGAAPLCADGGRSPINVIPRDCNAGPQTVLVPSPPNATRTRPRPVVQFGDA